MFGRRNHGWIGLDVGASAVKMAQVVRHDGRLRLTEAAIAARDEPWAFADDSPIPFASSKPEIAHAVMDASLLSGRAVAAVLPWNACELNTVEVSDPDPHHCEEAIIDEFSALGMSLDDRVVDYWPGLRRFRATKDVLNVVSTTRRWSEGVSQELYHAGFDCHAIDGLPLALARAVAEVDRSAETTSLAAIDWGFSKSTFTLVSKGQCVYVRNLRHVSMSQVHELISEQLGLSISESHQFLASAHIWGESRVANDEVAELLVELLEPTIDQAVQEIRRTIDHVASVAREKTPKRLYLFGGGATLDGIDLELVRRLEIPVRRWRLDEESESLAAERGTPTCLLAPAIVLSALRWEAV